MQQEKVCKVLKLILEGNILYWKIFEAQVNWKEVAHLNFIMPLEELFLSFL